MSLITASAVLNASEFLRYSEPPGMQILRAPCLYPDKVRSTQLKKNRLREEMQLLWRSAEAFSKLTSDHSIRQQPILQLQTPPITMPSEASKTLTNQPSEGGIYVGALGGEFNRRCHG
jgi:hypothetical protein